MMMTFAAQVSEVKLMAKVGSTTYSGSQIKVPSQFHNILTKNSYKTKHKRGQMLFKL